MKLSAAIDYYTWMNMFSLYLLFFLQCSNMVSTEFSNIALNKPTTQISTYRGENSQEWSASHAADGNINCVDPPTFQYYSATQSDGKNSSWWRVDLQQIYNVTRVIVRGKPTDTNNQLTGFRLYLTEAPVDKPDVSSSVYDSGAYGNGTFEIPTSKLARYCMIQNPKALRPTVLCEVEVYGTDVDLIQRIKSSVRTSMSSTGKYNSPHTTWNSDNAIDNVIYGEPNTCSCCIGTSGNEPPWWQIDLGRNYSISVIKIYGRTDGSSTSQYQNVFVFVGNFSMETVNGTLVYSGNPNDGSNTFTLQLEHGLSFRYLIIRRFTISVLTLCEVQLTLRNLVDRLRYTAITKQSSLFLNSTNYNSFKAIDGQKIYDVDTCQCCSVTEASHSPSWWQINLINKYLVDTVEVFGRQSGGAEQLQDAIIYASNTSVIPIPSMPSAMKIYQIPQITSTSSRHFIHRLPNPVIAQFFSVSLIGNILTLCEFNVYGTGPFCNSRDACALKCHCSDGKPCHYLTGMCQTPGCLSGWKGLACDTECSASRFGSNCSQTCDTCKEKICRNTDGFCINGCVPGYQPTDKYCNTQCSASRFGSNCSQTCDTCKEKICRNTDGFCINGCVPGYQPTDKYCNTPCEEGQYGQSCTKTCNGHCLHGNNQCSTTDGKCKQGCNNGYTGEKCNQSCPDSTYGKNCSQMCKTCMQMSCNKTDGLCFMGCVPGYKPNDTHCNTTCDEGRYGQDCSQSCSLYCLNGLSECNTTNGACKQGCIDGYFGEKCDKPCVSPKYGNNCTQTCNTCKQMACNNTDGFCNNGCVAGFIQDNYCRTACDDGRYGWNCTESCSGNCKGDTIKCNKTDGTCKNGCNQGYLGDKCDKQCTDGKYGFKCNETCHHCKNGNICGFQNGDCPNGCNPGYNGSRCDQECHQGYFGDCTHVCHCMDDLKCSITNGSCHNDCAFGWGGHNCSIDLNLLRRLKHIVTNQTGIFSTYDSSKAVDGKEIYDVDNCNCCSVTSGTAPSWWQIDLGDKYLIDALKIYGRSDTGQNNQLEYATIYAGNETLIHNYSARVLIYQIPKIRYTTAFTKHLEEPIIAQFFIVEHKQVILTICEFELFEKDCDIGTFGSGCRHQCHCSDKLSCYSVTGKCRTPECLSGWRGESCDQECEARTFGQGCNESCHCINQTKCDNVDGICEEHECDPGWLGASCITECETGTFGQGCNETCHCIERTNCDNVNGTCDKHECDPGWRGTSCDIECAHGKFGANCNHTCHCINDAACNIANGSCFGHSCALGWNGDACDTVAAPSQSETPSTPAAIAGGVGAAVGLAALCILIGAIVIYRRRNVKDSSSERNEFSNLDKALESRKSRTSEQHRSNMHAHENKSFDEEGETTMNSSGAGDYYSFGDQFMGIRIHELWDYIKEKMENRCEKLYSEFKTLPSGLVHPSKSADDIVNRGKNRYREMYAYDHSRVVLLDVEQGTNTDYINACYINGYDKNKKFVASQGPTKQMINDFWRMVWQLKSDKIVMLTNLIELGTTKCLQYWPKEDEEEEHCFGNVTVKVLKTEKSLDYNIRYFEAKKIGEPARRIRQFHFKSWPDKDVPDSSWCLVNFWRAVDTNAPSKAGPIVVHCSAGVGRTGTFIALDNLVSQARTEGCVRPLQIVETLRRQRVNMVQTREQNVYLHEAVADALLFGTHIIWTKQFPEVFTFMLQKGKGDIKTKLETQFELIERSNLETTSEVDDTTEYSNVETLQSESAAYRPKLKNRGSKFVQELGAIYIPNYKGKNTFLITMSPNKTTMEEFWSLIDDNNIKTIIMLTETTAASYQASCQLGSSANNGKRFSVNKIEEKIRKGYTERSFTFKESDREDEEYFTTVKQFQCTTWKDGYTIPGDTRSLLEMVDSVQKWQPHLSESQPVLIHCSNGCSRSGIVCMFLNELQRMKYEGGHINILESVKMMKKRQKYLIGTYEQYRFCFDLILAHVKTTEVYENL